MTDNVTNVLFLCTHNSARSVLAEALMNRHGAGRYVGHSAGSTPRGTVNPMALTFLAAQGYDVSGFASKSWDVFAGPDAPTMDVIITVCDDAAGEACPVWPGHPATAHWGISDPSRVPADDEDARFWAFHRAYLKLERRVSQFVARDPGPSGTPGRGSLLTAIHAEAGADAYA